MADPVEKDYGPKSDEAKYSHTHQHEVLAAGGADDEDFAFTFGKFMACVAFSVGYFVDIFILGATGSILTVINDDLGPSANFAWIITANAVGNSVTFPFVGRLSDIFGRRWLIISGSVVSLIGCALFARATSINECIGAGVLAGLGGSLHQICWSGLGEVIPRRSRGIAFGLLEASISPAQAFSPIIANTMAARYNWRDTYWIPFGLNIIALILTFLFYHPRNQYIRETDRTRWQQVLDLDWGGTFLFTAGLVLFLLGISFGGTTYSWKSAGTIVPIVVGFLLLVATGVYEAKVDQTFPVMPPVIFRNVRGFTVVLVGTFLYGMLYYATGVLWPQMIQLLFTTDRYKIGWYACGTGAVGFFASPIAGLLFRKIGHTRIQLVFYVTLMTAASAASAIVTPYTNVASTLLVCLSSYGVSATSAVAMTIVQLNTRHEYLGVAAALTSLARNTGGAIGTTIYSSILANKVAANLSPDAAVPMAKAGIPLADIPGVLTALTTGQGLSSLASLTQTQLGVAQLGVKWAYAHAFRTVWLSSLAFGIIGIITVSFVSDCAPLMTRNVEIKLEEGAHITAHTDTGEGHFVKHHDYHLGRVETHEFT
ncbi:hypothetical protein MMC08_005020 [Hypocenomyce scalaris]|nr:hypothetical protein [Hypocenomyce scalaris]